ncbi:MAG: efflux RND transporter permease subunit, partial [Myxococcota bacterium]
RGSPTGAVAAFVGRPAPKFYYNIATPSGSAHFAQLVVHARSPDHVEGLRNAVRRFSSEALPNVQVVATPIRQGPTVRAPISIRLFGDDLGALSTGAERVRRELRGIPGVRDVRDDLGAGVPQLEFEVNDAAASRAGIGRQTISLALLRQTHGLDAGELRTEDEPVPIRLRGRGGDRLPAFRLPSLDAVGHAPTALGAIATPRATFEPAVIHRRDRVRTVTVDAELDADVPYGRVIAALSPRLAQLKLDEVSVGFGGEAEESGEANAALYRTLPIGFFLLLLFLFVEFDSIRRVGIILTTVPLAAVGVIPGLVIGSQPLGFMSTLGIIALVGIVVNNAIVLLDVVERQRTGGATIDDALREAVRIRTRPILLTTATTVAGMIPLLFAQSPLWPPLASAMISGLLASAALTLLVVPALYRVLFRDKRPPPSAETT